MTTLQRLTLVVLAGLPLSACGPDPNVSVPFKYPDGRIVYPPPGGWPSYDKGGENGGSGGRS